MPGSTSCFHVERCRALVWTTNHTTELFLSIIADLRTRAVAVCLHFSAPPRLSLSTSILVLAFASYIPGLRKSQQDGEACFLPVSPGDSYCGTGAAELRYVHLYGPECLHRESLLTRVGQISSQMAILSSMPQIHGPLLSMTASQLVLSGTLATTTAQVASKLAQGPSECPKTSLPGTRASLPWANPSKSRLTSRIRSASPSCPLVLAG